jgi:hypothetical protein
MQINHPCLISCVAKSIKLWSPLLSAFYFLIKSTTYTFKSRWSFGILPGHPPRFALLRGLFLLRAGDRRLGLRRGHRRISLRRLFKLQINRGGLIIGIGVQHTSFPVLFIFFGQGFVIRVEDVDIFICHSDGNDDGGIVEDIHETAVSYCMSACSLAWKGCDEVELTIVKVVAGYNSRMRSNGHDDSICRPTCSSLLHS